MNPLRRLALLLPALLLTGGAPLRAQTAPADASQGEGLLGSDKDLKEPSKAPGGLPGMIDTFSPTLDLDNPASVQAAIDRGEAGYIYFDKDGKPLNQGKDLFPAAIDPVTQAEAVTRSLSYYGQGGGRNPDGTMRLGSGGMSVMPEAYEGGKDPLLQKALLDLQKRQAEQQQKLEDKRAAVGAKSLSPTASPPAGGLGGRGPVGPMGGAGPLSQPAGGPIPGTEEETGDPSLGKVAAYLPTEKQMAAMVPPQIIASIDPQALEADRGPSVYDITEDVKEVFSGPGAGGGRSVAGYGYGGAVGSPGRATTRLGTLGQAVELNEDLQGVQGGAGDAAGSVPSRVYEGGLQAADTVENNRKPPSVLRSR